MTESYWRQHSRRVIREALQEAKLRGLDAKATLALIDDRYPFGERAYYPYEVWLEERRIAREQLGLIAPSTTPHALKQRQRKESQKQRDELIADGQQSLF